LWVPGVSWEAVGEQEMVTTRRNKGEFKLLELTWDTDQSASAIRPTRTAVAPSTILMRI
jgi:hypothetical protein